MSCPFKKVVVIGATSGIGLGLAERLASEGAHVVVTGRRRDRLDAFMAKHGGSAEVFDISQIDEIPAVVQGIVELHPDIDCVLLNSGIQYRHDLANPASIDMKRIREEINVNYIAYVALCRAFLPFLLDSSSRKTLAVISSGLALVPLPHISNYAASKAALHAFIVCLRDQTQGKNIDIVEIYPPLVQTELHDEQKRIAGKPHAKWGMPLDDFVEEAYEGLIRKEPDWPIGLFRGFFDAFEVKRLEAFQLLRAKIAPVVGL